MAQQVCSPPVSSALPRTEEERRVLKARVETLARELGEIKAELARELSRFDDDGLWKEGFASLAEYSNAKLNLTAGETKELVRVHRKLARLDVSLETARELGWSKLVAVVGRMTRENRSQRLLDVETKTLHELRCKYQPGRMRVRQQALEAKCYTHMMQWNKAYSRMFQSRPTSLAEITDLPPLILPAGQGSGASAYIPGLLFCSSVIRRATKQAELATRLTSPQANLEYVCLHFLKTFPGAGYAGDAVQTGDWEREQGKTTRTDSAAEPKLLAMEAH